MDDRLWILVVDIHMHIIICMYKVTVDLSEKLTTSSENTCKGTSVINYVLEVSVISIHKRRLKVDATLVVYPKTNHRTYCVDGGVGGIIHVVVLIIIHGVEVLIFFLVKPLLSRNSLFLSGVVQDYNFFTIYTYVLLNVLTLKRSMTLL